MHPTTTPSRPSGSVARTKTCELTSALGLVLGWSSVGRLLPTCTASCGRVVCTYTCRADGADHEHGEEDQPRRAAIVRSCDALTGHAVASRPSARVQSHGSLNGVVETRVAEWTVSRASERVRSRPPANPEHPNEVDVAQPSEALIAQAEAEGPFNSCS